MLTRLQLRNFKLFPQIDIELGKAVVFIGPNNSGKTSALQALALWEIGVRRWTERRKGKRTPEKRPGVTINRRDLIATPVPDANLLWRNMHVRDVIKTGETQATHNVRIDVIVDGVTRDRSWACGLEFDYANEESLYSRPLRLSKDKNPERMEVPDEAAQVSVAFLPPMSGLAANETRLDTGAINVRVGEGRTAEVLRNLSYAISSEKDSEQWKWKKVQDHIAQLFGADLLPPQYLAERGEITMAYKEKGITLDLSSSGRGLQQTLLLLSYMYANPGSVLLLDEPDAHLEILRQRETYELLNHVASENGNQIIAASHSEVWLNEAADRDIVIAFVGNPHRIDDRGSQVLKSLKEIGWEHYYQAQQTGWVLYLEGSTDLATLRAFAEALGHHDALQALERPFVHYVGNQPDQVRRHFYGLREAIPQLLGVALFDRLSLPLPPDLGATGLTWQWREIENYICFRETLLAYAAYAEHTPNQQYGPLFDSAERDKRVTAMEEAISELEHALDISGLGSPWDPNTKVSDIFLPRVFDIYFRKLGLPNIMLKRNYYELVPYVPKDKISQEVADQLDAIVRVWRQAKPSK